MSKLKMLKNGQCALVNTGTVEELRRVLKYCFPKDFNLVPTHVKYFIADDECNRYWLPTSVTNLEEFPTSDFIAELDAMEANAQPLPHVEKAFKPSPFDNWTLLLDEGTCIQYLKERNYKIFKPTITHEEI
jgi:hypothetical protein